MHWLSALLALALSQDGAVTPHLAARIQVESAKAERQVIIKFGNPTPMTPLSDEEQLAMHQQRVAAVLDVLDRYGVSDKAWTRYHFTRTKEQAIEQVRIRLELEEAEANQPNASTAVAAEALAIQRGFGGAKTVVMLENPSEGLVIEHGLSEEELSDQELAASLLNPASQSSVAKKAMKALKAMKAGKLPKAKAPTGKARPPKGKSQPPRGRKH
jgi:hypothetical protein